MHSHGCAPSHLPPGESYTQNVGTARAAQRALLSVSAPPHMQGTSLIRNRPPVGLYSRLARGVPPQHAKVPTHPDPKPRPMHARKPPPNTPTTLPPSEHSHKAFIWTSIFDKYSGAMKVATRLDRISHCKSSSDPHWSKRWTYRVLIMNTHRD